jgi:Tfp pilus assembly protein FimV
MANENEAELEAKVAAAERALAEMQAELERVRGAKRADVLAEVQANVRKYKITRTELSPFFPQIRKPKSAPAASVSNSGKTRGRPKKVTAETGTTD